MIVLGIESSCDETACAVVKNGHEILSNVISSQIDLQKEYGGVVPELACRRHVDILFPVIEDALNQANISLNDIDLFAVAQGPGLIGALMIGLQAAKTLAFTLQKPWIGINHIESHLYAALMSHSEQPPPLPCLGLVLSGGHSAIVHIEAIGKYRLIGQTVDDAIGEAFDKVSRLLGFTYPGGPIIEKLALEGDANRFPFRSGKVKQHPYAFSFSGLKTAVLYAHEKTDDRQTICDLAASFQRAAFDDVINKIQKAAEEYGCFHVLMGGGVTNSQTLRIWFQAKAPHIKTYWPSKGLSLDNAAMIAGLGFHQYNMHKKSSSWDSEPLTTMPLET